MASGGSAITDRDRAALAACSLKRLTLFRSRTLKRPGLKRLSDGLSEIDARTVELIPWEDVRAELFSKSVIIHQSFPKASSAD